MNEVIACLLTRRSVRSYLTKQVEEEKLQEILLAGTYAASGMGRQPVRIVVLQDPAEIAQLERMNASILGNPDSHPFYGAPTGCVVFADTNAGTWVEDGSLAIGNLMAAAHSLGVSSCWIHRAREEFSSAEGKALMQKWGVGAQYAGVGHCILGYAAAEPAPAKPRKADLIIRA